ncbi:UvrD-helicase domain-containing protein [Mucilaginibacter sp. NFX135]|uniref:UvrD-helicase domain-containing protein n=1 Tax=Mucilaginibacter sp. NFX135 TaxID=3402687 RepID=UPI003AFB46AF
MLNRIQHDVVFNSPSNTIVSASPGSGKTKTLVARAQHKLDSLPHRKSLVLITYTNAGADEIASRLVTNQESDVFIGTIHRFCLEFILRPFGWLYKYPKPKVISYDELLEFIELNPLLDLGNSPLDELNKIKKGLDGSLDLTVKLANDWSVAYVAELFYDFLKSKKAIDFNEILYRSYVIIFNNDFVVTSLANKFYEISVDEFQDTNIFQYEIFKTINKKHICTFFMVGDEKQRIYRFAGAIDNAFNKATADFSSEIRILEHTYRSTNNIINAYSSLFAHHPLLINESKYKNENLPCIIHQTNKNNHNETLLNCVEKFIQSGGDLYEIAILSTSWIDALNVSRALRHKYPVVGLGALPHKSNNTSTFGLLRAICRFNYLTSVRNLRIVKRNMDQHCAENNLTYDEKELTNATNLLITKTLALDKSMNLIDGLAYLKQIFDSIFSFKHSAFEEISSLIDIEESKLWTLDKYMETVSGMNGININTIHQSKGLEFDLVILNNINEGKIPYQSWNFEKQERDTLTVENEDDGRHLFYVGLSRAKAALIVLHNWKPSIFVSYVQGK